MKKISLNKFCGFCSVQDITVKIISLQKPQNLLRIVFFIWETYKKISENPSQNKKIYLAKKNLLVPSTRKFTLIKDSGLKIGTISLK